MFCCKIRLQKTKYFLVKTCHIRFQCKTKINVVGAAPPGGVRGNPQAACAAAVNEPPCPGMGVLSSGAEQSPAASADGVEEINFNKRAADVEAHR